MKFNLLPLAILLFLTTTSAYSQNYTVKGSIVDTAGVPMTGALIKLTWPNDSVATAADIDGLFSFNNVRSASFNLYAAFIGFESYTKSFRIESGNSITIPAIVLKPATNSLNEVVVTAVTAVKIGEDTVTYNAASFPVREGDAVDEVLKKLPGVKVDDDGNVTNQGETITKIRINGKDFFGTDVATAIKNLPADIIKNLQFIDDYGDQANLTGIKTGEPEKILNITIQEDKRKGYTARASAGMGSQDRYSTSLRANVFKGEEQISFDGTVTNANVRGGGGDGISSSNTAGLNYKNEWGEVLAVDGGYNFNNRNNNTIGRSFTQNFLENFTRLEDASTDNKSENFSHELSGNIEFRPDSLNFFKFSPRLVFNSGSVNNIGYYDISQSDLRTIRDNATTNDTESANLSSTAFYNHRFKKKGRNVSIRGNITYSSGENDRYVLNDYTITRAGSDSLRIQNQNTNNNNNTTRSWAQFSYMEPLGRRTYLETSYLWSHSSTNSVRQTSDIMNGVSTINPDLSNDYEYSFTTNRVGLNYRFIDQKFNYTLGMNVQPAVLKGTNISKDISTTKKTFNYVPSARFVYKFTRQKALQVNYFGRNNQPTFMQLQPLTDNSNLQNTVSGNPDLNPEFIHTFSLRYNQSDWNMGHTLYANLSYNQTNDKIVTTKNLVPGTVNQITSYTNTDGYYTLRGDYSYGKPFAERKFTVTYGGAASMNNNVAFVNQEKNIAKNLMIRQEIELELDLPDIVDLELETSYSINSTRYSQGTFEDRQTNRLQFQLRGRNYFFKDLTLGYDLRKTINTGFDNLVRNPTILRLFTEYRFMKNNMATIRFDAYDLFNENTGISRDVFDNVIVDRQTNRLGRYFMLSFNMRLNKFGGRPTSG